MMRIGLRGCGRQNGLDKSNRATRTARGGGDSWLLLLLLLLLLELLLLLHGRDWNWLGMSCFRTLHHGADDDSFRLGQEWVPSSHGFLLLTNSFFARIPQLAGRKGLYEQLNG